MCVAERGGWAVTHAFCVIAHDLCGIEVAQYQVDLASGRHSQNGLTFFQQNGGTTMAHSNEQLFWDKFSDQPAGAIQFFKEVQHHFEQQDDVKVHFTKTRGGDLRLAFSSGIVTKGKIFNFATLSWRPRPQRVLVVTYLEKNTTQNFGSSDVRFPPKTTKRQKVEVRLDATAWSHGAASFIAVLEAGKSKAFADRDLA